MKRFFKELLLLAFQLLLFYVLPLFAGPTDAMGMVFLIIVGTFLLGFLAGLLSGWRGKWCWPVLVSILFLPTLPLYYNHTALIHAVWYLVVSAAGMLLGWGIRKLLGRMK